MNKPKSTTDELPEILSRLSIETRPLLYPSGKKYADEAYIKGLPEATKAITQAMLDIPELQSEWEEDIHGTPNPNGKARNELRAQIRTAIKLIGDIDE